MKREKREPDSRPPMSEACRLPPRGLKSYYSIRAATDEYSLRFLVRRYASEVVIAVLAFSLLTALTIAPAIDYGLQVSVSKVAPLVGTRGWDASNQSCQSSTSVHLINSTLFDYRNGWRVSADRLGQNPAMYNGSVVSDGFRVTVVESSAEFLRSMAVPIKDYDSISASLQVEAMSGSAIVKLNMNVGWPHSDQAVSQVSSGQMVTLAVNPSFYTDYWFLWVWFVIVISAEEQAVVVIHSFDVEAHSTRTLTPVSIDLQTTDGRSLLPSPYPDAGSWNLLLDVSRPDDTKEATFVIQLANETWYLPPGNYSVKAGWSPSYEWQGFDYELAGFAVVENVSTFLRVRLPSLRLSIELSPYLVSGYITLYSYARPYGNIFDYGFDVDTEVSIYWPASVASIGIDVVHFTPWNYHGAVVLWYESDGSSDLLVTVAYPCVVLLGVVLTGFDIGTVLLLAALVIALLVRFRHALFPKTTKPILGDPALIPIIMLLTGAFLPWFSYDYHVGVYSGVVLPPITIITRQTAFGLTAPYMLDEWGLLLPLYLLLFWAPILGTLSQIGTEEPALSWRRVICIVCPPALALASWLVAAGIGWLPDAGIWLVVLSPVVFFARVGLQRFLAAIQTNA